MSVHGDTFVYGMSHKSHSKTYNKTYNQVGVHVPYITSTTTLAPRRGITRSHGPEQVYELAFPARLFVLEYLQSGCPM